MDPYALALAITGSVTAISAAISTGATRVIVTKNKIMITREALKGVPPQDRPAVLQALAEIL